jgi:hypothetical protein
MDSGAVFGVEEDDGVVFGEAEGVEETELMNDNDSYGDSEEEEEENEDLSSAESSRGAVSMLAEVPMQLPSFGHIAQAPENAPSVDNSTPPMPPSASPDGGGDSAVGLPAAGLEAGQQPEVFGNLDDFFSQPATRDVAVVAANSALGATSPVDASKFGELTSPGMRSGSLGMGLSTAEDIIERSERVVAAGDGSGDNADDMGNLQDFEIGEQEGDGLVGTTPTTAQARAGHPGIAIGGLLGLSPSEAKTPLGPAGMHLTGTPTQLPRPLSSGRRRMGTAPGEPSPFDDDEEGDEVGVGGDIDDDDDDGLACSDTDFADMGGDLEDNEEEKGNTDEDEDEDEDEEELDAEQQKMAEELGMFGDA